MATVSRRFGSRLGTALFAGALALALAPAAQALADDGVSLYSYNNTAGQTKALVGNDGDPLKSGVELVSQGGGSYTYMGYAHSDNGGHYQSYTLYTTLTTDADGVLTAVDVTSGNDTFAGKWGHQQAKASSNPIEGYLPVGVDFEAAAVEGSDGQYTAKLVGDALGGYGYSLSQVEIIPVSVQDGKYTLGDALLGYTPGSGKGAKPTLNADVLAIAEDGTATITVPSDGGYNLVKCSYSIGNDQTGFNCYFAFGGDAATAKAYVDSIEPTTWADNPVNGQDGANYTTNRDGWTAIMGTLMMRQLYSWGLTLSDSSISTDLDGEIGGIDTVSGATKTSVPFVTALYDAQANGYVKGVAEDLVFTIDGANAADAASLPGLTVSDPTGGQDRTSVTQDADGLYTANVVFKPNGGGRLSLDAIYLYDLSGQTVGTQGMMALAKQNTPAEDATGDAEIVYPALASYAPAKSYISYNTTSGEYTALEALPEDDNIAFSYKSSGDTIVKVKNQKATHLVMKYTVGHGSIAVAYDLANMAKVPATSALLEGANAADAAGVSDARAAYASTPNDVKPFVSGLANLKAAEAQVAKDADDKAEDDKAEDDKAEDDKKAQEEKEAAENAQEAAKAEANLANATVTVAKKSVAYTGKAQKPAVTVKSKSGKALKAGTDYTVSYSANKAVGTAKVTVTGKGKYTGKNTKATFKITQAANSAKAAKASVKKSFKKAAVKKKAQTVALPKVTAKFGTAKWSVAKKDAKKVLSLKNGKVVVKKGAKKGTYSIQLKASVAKTKNYKAATTKNVTVKVTVK